MLPLVRDSGAVGMVGVAMPLCPRTDLVGMALQQFPPPALGSVVSSTALQPSFTRSRGKAKTDNERPVGSARCPVWINVSTNEIAPSSRAEGKLVAFERPGTLCPSTVLGRKEKYRWCRREEVENRSKPCHISYVDLKRAVMPHLDNVVEEGYIHRT
jgi:hypothetical protein